MRKHEEAKAKLNSIVETEQKTKIEEIEEDKVTKTLKSYIKANKDQQANKQDRRRTEFENRLRKLPVRSIGHLVQLEAEEQERILSEQMEE